MRALRLIRKVDSAGKLRLDNLPLAEGQVVEIIVLPVDDEMDDLTQASESGLAFWHNDTDDQVWNDAVSAT